MPRTLPPRVAIVRTDPACPLRESVCGRSRMTWIRRGVRADRAGGPDDPRTKARTAQQAPTRFPRHCARRAGHPGSCRPRPQTSCSPNGTNSRRGPQGSAAALHALGQGHGQEVSRRHGVHAGPGKGVLAPRKLLHLDGTARGAHVGRRYAGLGHVLLRAVVAAVTHDAVHAVRTVGAEFPVRDDAGGGVLVADYAIGRGFGLIGGRAAGCERQDKGRKNEGRKGERMKQDKVVRRRMTRNLNLTRKHLLENRSVRPPDFPSISYPAEGYWLLSTACRRTSSFISTSATIATM